MARHSHWANIKNKKAAADAVRGKALTLHAKLIEIAARKGGDPNMNPSLRSAIDKAKGDNVPNHNIERAIKRGTGEDREGVRYEEVIYEAFGPEGVVFLIDVVTENKNRTFANLRTLLQKNGGNIGAAGTVAWKFEKKAYFLVDIGTLNKDEAELALIDSGADDLNPLEENLYEVFGAWERLFEIKNNIIKTGVKIEKDELIWKAKEDIRISDLEIGKKVVNLMEIIEEDEDVKNLYSNANIEGSILAHI